MVRLNLAEPSGSSEATIRRIAVPRLRSKLFARRQRIDAIAQARSELNCDEKRKAVDSVMVVTGQKQILTADTSKFMEN